jgi:signal peptidase I
VSSDQHDLRPDEFDRAPDPFDEAPPAPDDAPDAPSPEASVHADADESPRLPWDLEPRPSIQTSGLTEFEGLTPAPSAPAGSVWPSETAGTSERAIVTDAMSPLLLHRLGVWRDEVFAWIRTLVSAGVYAVLIVTFGFQVARVEGHSMSPTLGDQDRLIVNKLVYRFGPPRREDIVMLYYPPDPSKSFVKRVIAEEGDSVKIENGRVYVNDIPLDDEYVAPENRSHDNSTATVVKDGYYFVMGDNRNNSSDSRSWGEVPKRYIIGKVQLRWWPIRNARLF